MVLNTETQATKRQKQASKRVRKLAVHSDIYNIVGELAPDALPIDWKLIVMTNERHTEIKKILSALDKFRLGRIDDSQLRDTYRAYLINTCPISRRG